MARTISNSDLRAVRPESGYTLATVEQVRAWAAEQDGMEVNAKGALPHAVVHASNKAHTRNRLQFVIGSEVTPLQEFSYTVAGTKRKRTFKARVPEVREWAQGQGLTVGARGRLQQSVIDAYGNANAKPTTPRKPRAPKAAEQAEVTASE